MLKKNVINEIKKSHISIHNDFFDYKNRILPFLNKLKYWKVFLWGIGISGLVIFFNYLFDYSFYFFSFIEIKFDDVLKTVTTGTITLVSMNMALVNLFLSNLKDEREHFEDLLNRKINYQFVIFLGISLILYFILLNIFSNNFCCAKENVLLFLLYLLTFYLFLIVNMYKTIFDFLVKSARKSLLRNEYIKEIHSQIYLFKFNTVFYKKYIEVFRNFKIVENTFIYAFDENAQIKIENKFNKEKYLLDINIDKLTKNIGVQTGNIGLLPIEVNRKIASKQILLYSNNLEFPDDIYNCFILKSKKDLRFEEKSKELRNYYLKQLHKKSNEKDMESVDEILENLKLAFDIYFDFLKNDKK